MRARLACWEQNGMMRVTRLAKIIAVRILVAYSPTESCEVVYDYYMNSFLNLQPL